MQLHVPFLAAPGDIPPIPRGAPWPRARDDCRVETRARHGDRDAVVKLDLDGPGWTIRAQHDAQPRRMWERAARLGLGGHEAGHDESARPMSGQQGRRTREAFLRPFRKARHRLAQALRRRHRDLEEGELSAPCGDGLRVNGDALSGIY